MKQILSDWFCLAMVYAVLGTFVVAALDAYEYETTGECAECILLTFSGR